MHAVMITFHSAAALEDVGSAFTDFAAALRSVHGFVSKTWLVDGDTWGGFYVFTDRASAERYLDSELVAGLQAVPAFTDFDVRQFDVLDDLSRSTGLDVPAHGAVPV